MSAVRQDDAGRLYRIVKPVNPKEHTIICKKYSIFYDARPNEKNQILQREIPYFIFFPFFFFLCII